MAQLVAAALEGILVMVVMEGMMVRHLVTMDLVAVAVAVGLHLVQPM